MTNASGTIQVTIQGVNTLANLMNIDLKPYADVGATQLISAGGTIAV